MPLYDGDDHMRASLRVMLSLLDTDERTRRTSITHCLRRCLSRTPSVYIHESLNDDEETPGTLLEHHHAGLERWALSTAAL